MAAPEVTKGIVAIGCDENGEVMVFPAKFLHIADKETFDAVVSGQVELKAKVDGDYVVFTVDTTTSSTGEQA